MPTMRRDRRPSGRAIAPAVAVLLLCLAPAAGAEPPEKPTGAGSAPEGPRSSESAGTSTTTVIAPATTATAAQTPGEEAPGAPALSWSVLFGAIPSSGGILEAQLGFSGMPLAAFHLSLSRDASVGLLAGMDYAWYRPELAFDAGLVLAVPIRYAMPIGTSAMSLGLRAEPGFRVPAPGTATAALLLGLDANLGFAVGENILVGGGVSIPLGLAVGGGATALVIPLLIGPAFEIHVVPPLALTVEAKFGPHLTTEGTGFGMKVHAGVGFRI